MEKMNECFLNPLFEIEVEKNGVQLIKQPLLFIINQFIKDYPLYKQDFGINDNIIVILRMGSGAEIKLPLFLKSLPDNWQLGQDIPGGVLHEKA